ncbi:uncharacterized protein M437DRAFT_88564 [Aureobasidium melanogenum CBS 110374]|uniref:Uncharacterized protein n=1 Tax=Aureobasidium melanogenum (strain CBS 110374) TaxID=1043003 RepID=A0A074VCI1_AURM1|nr:uncharacterized protein M437DRAFT_88564 [Aureobasidium melanogenum CBS 110374]KEQ58415.1 hypothetical protein M437DRAFT_88564 [Aureobasidium melanogenum CBS 110374]
MSSTTLQYNWLWCDDNQKVTEWFLSEPDIHEYALFYSSFINHANRTWSIFADKAPRVKKLQRLELFIIECLCKNPIPADMLIEAFKKYNKYIGGTRGNLKGKGLIKFGDDTPEMRAIKDGKKELHHQIATYHKKHGDTRFEDTENENTEDGEMKDVEAQPTEIVDENGERPITFELAIVGGKKNDEDQDMA